MTPHDRPLVPRLALAAICASLFLLGTACGPGDDPASIALVDSSADPRQNVLVIDDGFDPTEPSFHGKVAGRYSIVCQNGGEPTTATPRAQTMDISDAGTSAPDDAGASDGGLPFDLQKANRLQQLRTRDE